MRAVVGATMWSSLIVEQRGDPVGGLDNDPAALTTRTAFGAAARSPSLSFERDDASPTITRTEMDPDLVYEHGSLRAVAWLGLVEDVDFASPPTRAVLHDPFGRGEQRVVAPFANVATGMDPGTALTNEDGSSLDALAIKHLRSEPL
jgi:hypothetical protein